MSDTTEIKTVAENTPQDNLISQLKRAEKAFNEVTIFAPGDIVEWKPGMQNKRSEGPFVVIEVLREAALAETKDGGSPYFREPLDIVLGHFDSYGDFLIYHYDSRRLQIVEY